MEVVVVLLTIAIPFLALRAIGRRSWQSKRPAVSRTRSPRATSSPAARTSAQVLWVIDGDTVDVRRGGRRIRVRLDSIDCPEDGQPWGGTAKAGLIKMIGGKSVSLEEHGIVRP